MGLNHVCILNKKGGAKFLSNLKFDQWKTPRGILWLHLDYTNPEAVRWLNEESKIPAPMVEGLIEASSRPRVSSVGNNLLVVLRDVNHNPGAEPEDMVAVRIWIEQNRIISTRKRDLRSVQDIVQKLNEGNGPLSAGDFLVSLCEKMIFRMGDTIDDTEDEIARIEDMSLQRSDSKLSFELSELRRQILAIKRYLAPQKDAMYKLPLEKCKWFDDPLRLRLREAGSRLVHHLEDIDTVRERAWIMQEEINSRTNEQVNRRMYILSLVTVIFMPLTFLTGLLGVNLGGIPGGNNVTGFLSFVILLGGVGILELIFLRRKKWF